MNRTACACLLLVIVTVAAYWPVSEYGFVSYDDPVYVLENAHVQAGPTWAGLSWAWTSTESSNWHPLTWVSHMIDCRLFGVEHPGWHHLTSLMLHTINSLLLFLLFRQMTGAFWRPLFVALVFSLHPLHVESVAWISERKDVLSTMFWLLCVMSYVRYARRPSFVWFGGSIVLLALGLMCKPMLVTTPFLLLLLDFWPLNRLGPAPMSGPPKVRALLPRLWPLIVEKISMFGLVALSSAITYAAQSRTEAAHFFYPLGHRFGTIVMGYANYIWKTIRPVNLAVFYPNHVGMWNGVGVILVSVALLTATVAVVLLRKKPYLLVGWFWFLGTLIPVIGIVSLGQQAMADRYMYMPMTGLLVIAAWGGADLCRATTVRRWIAGGIAAAAVLGCLWLVPAQIATWQDSGTLFSHAIRVTDRNHLAHNSLGVVLLSQRKQEEAIEHFREAVSIQPVYPKALYNLAYALQLRGELDEAVRTYRTVLEMNPDNARAHQNLGVAFLAQHRADQAIEHFNRALQINPLNPRTLHTLARALSSEGRADEAIERYREAVRIQPDFAPSRKDLASILVTRGEYQEAIEHLKQALRIFPDDPRARQLLDRAEALQRAEP